VQRQLTTVVSSRINHNEGAENARRQTDKETRQNVQRLMTSTPRRPSLWDHCHVRQLMRTFRNSDHLCPEEPGSQSCRRGAHVSATCYYFL